MSPIIQECFKTIPAQSELSSYTVTQDFGQSIKQKESQAVYSGDSENAKTAVETVLVLAKGEHFIFPTSNMATAALYINPNMIPHFLIG